jgi:hypothetical protein
MEARIDAGSSKLEAGSPQSGSITFRIEDRFLFRSSVIEKTNSYSFGFIQNSVSSIQNPTLSTLKTL